MYQQFTSVTAAGTVGGSGSAVRIARPAPLITGRPNRGVSAGEPIRLALFDFLLVGALSFAAGSTALATGIRVAAVLAAFALAGLYRPRLRYAVLDDLPRLLVGVGVVLSAGAWLPVPTLLTPTAFAHAPLAWPAALLAAVVAGRGPAYAALHRGRRRAPGAPTIVVGTGDLAVRLTEVLAADRTFGMRPVGLVGPAPLTGPALPVPMLGPVAELDATVARYPRATLVVAFPGTPDADLVATLRRCRGKGLPVFVVPRLFELSLGRCGAELVEGIPLVRMAPEPAHRRRWVLKRALDVAGAAVGLLLLAPVFAACALAVRFESGRAGVLFRQERIGRGGRPFTILKFRSLTPASEVESRIRWNINHDDRVGPVGRVLRATSLDELPQLLNVLRGDMSLVGPRPERPYFVEQFQRAYGGYHDRHRVPAGITGWAQIHGLRGDTSIEERVRFDNHYIENWSLGLDLKIIVRTVASMTSIHRR
jgi:exopolysaccharide biosynthesis polyprenyl glycosylphosphotransferase